MALKVQQNFVTSIDGVTVNDIKEKLNYKDKNTYKDRLEVVNEALEYGDEFYKQYFDEYLDACITNNDYLLSNTNVCRSLETMGTYLLMSDDIKDDNEFLARQEQLDKKMNRENEYSNDGHTNLLEDDAIIPKDNSNHKKLKKQTITSEDLNRDDSLGEILRDYQDFLTRIQYKLKEENKSDRVRPRFIYAVNSGQVKEDMLIIKDSFKGIHGYKLRHYNKETQLPSYDLLDYTNLRHLLGAKLETEKGQIKAKGLLYFMPSEDYQDDFNCVLIDLQNIINQINLTNFEQEVLYMKRSNISDVDVAKQLETYEMKVKRAMETIAKKVVKKAHALGYEYKGGIKKL